MKTFRLTKDIRYNILRQVSDEIISELKAKIILLKDENRKLKKEIEKIESIKTENLNEVIKWNIKN